LVYQNAVQELNIPQDRLGVPTLIIGETVLVGSGEIPEQLPGLIERGLASGGIALPQITGLADLAAAAAPPPVTILTETPPVVAPAAVDATAAPAAVVPATPPPAAEVAPLAAPGWREMLRRDPAGNTLALVVLVVMLLSVIVVTLGYITDAAYLRTAWPAMLAKFIPTFAVIGLGVALYLSYVEVLGATAVCGPVGDCNSVQSSPYAKLFGFLPVGVLGALGYVGIFAAYFMQQRGPTAYRRFASLALWGMVWFGLLFSIYLTFLEPFVIGATCIWCVTSAVVMTLLFWASTPAALAALQPADDDPLLT
jgi:uncharacterized membrane protein